MNDQQRIAAVKTDAEHLAAMRDKAERTGRIETPKGYFADMVWSVVREYHPEHTTRKEA